MNKLIGMWDGYGFMGYKGSSRYYAFDLALACSAYRALKKVEPDRVKEHDKVMEDKVLITFNVWDEFKARSIECKALNVNGNVVSVDNIKVIDNNYTCTVPLSSIQLNRILITAVDTYNNSATYIIEMEIIEREVTATRTTTKTYTWTLIVASAVMETKNIN